MPLESLGQPFNPDEPGRKLREVQVEHEQEPSTTAQALWKRILNPLSSPFRGAEPNSWKESIEASKEFQETVGFATEISWLLIVRMNVERYVPTEKEGTQILQIARGMGSTGETKLLYILALEYFNPVEAKKSYEHFRETAEKLKLDHGLQRIFEFGSERGHTGSRQLCRLIENKLYPDEAERKTKRFLENTAYYDEQLKRWRSWYNYTRMADGNVSYVPGSIEKEYTHLELQGVLLQAEVDPQKALRRYNELKESDLYDKDLQLWKDTYLGASIHHDLESQLLEILVVNELEKRKVLVPSLAVDTKITLPEERNF